MRLDGCEKALFCTWRGLAKVIILLTALGLPNSAILASPAKNPTVEMEIAGKGKVTIELFQKDAPKTVDHFLKLCKSKFYDGVLVHRVVPSFVVQAGDPLTKKVGVNDPSIGSH